MTDWIQKVASLVHSGVPVVRVRVASVRGSVPREAGASMCLWRTADGTLHSHGTVGGGHLEWMGMQVADEMLQPASPAQRLQKWLLGASLGQCCGGVVYLHWERFERPDQLAPLLAVDVRQPWLRYQRLTASTDAAADRLSPAPVVSDAHSPACLLAEGHASFTLPNDTQAAIVQDQHHRYLVERLHDQRQALWLYGAGHVGQALVSVLDGLPFKLTWVDSRQDQLAQATRRSLPADLLALCDDPDVLAASAPAAAWHLVMTHNHDQDFAICEALLRSGKAGFIGVIGSASKARRFRQRLLQKGYDPAQVAAMACPLGAPGIRSKLPAAIALSIGFDLMQRLENPANTATPVSPMTDLPDAEYGLPVQQLCLTAVPD